MLTKPKTVIGKRLKGDIKIVMRQHAEGFSKTTFKLVGKRWTTVKTEQWIFKDVRYTVEP